MKFNLATDPWVLCTGGERLSLASLFSGEKPDVELAGTPIEKFVVFRLLLAVGQAACQLSTEKQWKELTTEGMCSRITDYLKAKADCFELYDEKRPFLQFPQVRSKEKSYAPGSLVLGVAGGNATVVTQIQQGHALSVPETVYVLLQQLIFSLGGKKPDHEILVDPAAKKSKSSGYSPAVGFMGYLHSYARGSDLLETVRFNLISTEELEEGGFPCENGMGTAPWEKMPSGENDEAYTKTYMGRLIPMSRFCHLIGDRLHMTEGLKYPALDTGVCDPSVTVTKPKAGKKTKYQAIWAMPDKAPWRQLTSLIAFLSPAAEWHCRQLSQCLNRSDARGRFPTGVWCTGVALSSNAGEQYLTGTDDFVESEINLKSDALNFDFYEFYAAELAELDQMSKILWSCVLGYQKELSSENKAKAGQATSAFWQKAGTKASALISACENGTPSALRRDFARLVLEVYDEVCPAVTARQLLAVKKSRPNLSKYFVKEV